MNSAIFLRVRIRTIHYADRYAPCMHKSVILNHLAKAKLTSTSRVIAPSAEKDRVDNRLTSTETSSHLTQIEKTPFRFSNLNVKSSGIYNCGKLFTKVPVPNEVNEPDRTSQGLPTDEQLEAALKLLSNYLPRLFAAGVVPAQLFHQNVILENNFRGKRTIGIVNYFSQVSLLKIYAYAKFAYVKFHVLKITKHPEEGAIKCRWRISGIGGLSIIFAFWKFSMRSYQENAPTWLDGFSTYYIGSDGLIYKHVIDRMMPDDNKVNIDKSAVTSKVTLFAGLSPSQQEYICTNSLLKYTNGSM